MYKQHLWTSTVNLGKMPHKVERVRDGRQEQKEEK